MQPNMSSRRQWRDAMRRFLRRTEGFVITTENIVWMGLTVCLLVVGMAAVREVILHEFLDVAESIASRENGYVFSADAEVVVYPDAPFNFPTGIGSTVTRPVPTNATKESQNLYQGGQGLKEADPLP